MYKYIIIISFLFISSACHNHDHSEHDHSGHDHGSHDEDNHTDKKESNVKTVELNPAQFKYAEIDTGWFEMKNISNVVKASGHTRLAPQNQADISMPIGGTIQQINVVEGNFVKKGKILARMTSMEYSNMLLEKAKLSTTIAGSQAQIDYLQKEYNRQKELANQNINARKKFEKVAADLQSERDKVTAVNEQIQLMESTISMVGNTDGNTLQIISPISGYVTKINVHIGTLVQPGMSIFKIVDNSKMHVDLMVYEKDLSIIKIGQKVRFILTNQDKEDIIGKIYNIGKSFENESKTVAVHADIKNGGKGLIPDMYINALINVGEHQSQTLPEDAIIMAEGRHFIFVIKKENEGHDHITHEGHNHNEHQEENMTMFTRIEVKSGNSQLGSTEITPLEKLQKGDIIVTKGAYYLQSHLQKTEGGGGHHH